MSVTRKVSRAKAGAWRGIPAQISKLRQALDAHGEIMMAGLDVIDELRADLAKASELLGKVDDNFRLKNPRHS